MKQELFINVSAAEIRAALTHEDVLVELLIDQPERASVVGNIYLGRVERVMKGLEAAFVDIGLARSGFLGLEAGRRHSEEGTVPVHEGETVLVQITKDAIDGKGVQLSRRLTLPGRYLVYAPTRDRVMVSRQIADETERKRLTELMAGIASPDEGFILRTAAEGASVEDLKADCDQIRDLWRGVTGSQSTSKVPACLYSDLDPILRVLRDYALNTVNTIYLDDPGAAASARAFCMKFMSGMEDRVKIHTGPQQMFEQFGIEDEIVRACERRVDLASGGGLVIETVEALTAIDVNTGRFDNASDLERVAFLTNCEAAEESARQIRLRNISGLIVVDFIHMEEGENWNKVLELFEKVANRDRNPTRILGVTEAGLVEVTRRRRREPLLNTMTHVCQSCGGIGRVKSLGAISIEILRALRREASITPPGELVVYAADNVANSLENNFGVQVDEIEDDFGRTIHLRSDEEYIGDNYDIVVE
ncbi:MAG: ribonuclease E/G [Pseudomonadota bacterium]|nr:ribonuclease E/G [Pseudomonadota bacterium]